MRQQGRTAGWCCGAPDAQFMENARTQAVWDRTRRAALLLLCGLSNNHCQEGSKRKYIQISA